jgi:hypothetical protein
LRDDRGPWYLLTGFVLGAVLGLAYAWVWSPVEYVDTSPASLRADFKDQYRALIAAAYVANHDLARAQARLNLLDDPQIPRTLAEQAQRTLAEEGSPEVAQALALLALDLGQGPTPVVTSPPATPEVIESPTEVPLSPTLTLTNPVTTTVATPASAIATPVSSPIITITGTPRITRTPLPTGTPLPTRTPTSTPSALFALQERTFICDPDVIGPLIQVLAEDAAGEQIPGVEAVVNWDGGEDHFFTGLKPELGLGYADFAMTPGVVYTLHLADGGQPITELTAAECEANDGSRYWGSWLLVFAQPGG